MATETMVSEFRTVIEGDPEPVPAEERERRAALEEAKRQNENGLVALESTPPAGGSEVVRSASLESDPGSRSGSSTRSLSRSSSSNRSRKEMLVLKGQAVGALPRGASQDDDELEGVIERAGIAPSEGGEVHETIVGDKDPVPEQEEERRAAVAGGQEKKGMGAKIKEKVAGLFGGRGGERRGSGSESASGEADETSKAADLGSGWTGAGALTQDASKANKGVTSAADLASAGGEHANPELADNHWGPALGSGGAGVDDVEGVNDDGVIRIRGGGYDSDEELEFDPPEEGTTGGGFEGGMMRLRGGGDTGDLAKEEAAAETVLEAGAKKSTGLTAAGGSVFKARKEEEDDTDYDHGVKGVGTGKEPSEAHGVNTSETGKVKAPGLGGRIVEELQAFTGMFSGKKTEK
ncbi:hypothetical protein KFL_000540080 [Klebsormidium nitens]|uniref:Uncharacterized protein n=1 Tax=Klebsormidium nitens TaxID=105231 RepID=A0A0U9HQY9_KLENI|nr:hypothetical protein KFL_000540080 [Klebsormidium nitens]|eukprot:GAQ80431.1 hypothetical protein KFL_000540080 [Klebsormidium nitens]